MKKLELSQRVKFKDKDFLSNGFILSVLGNRISGFMYVVKLDEKAPNEYAYDTDEVLAFPSDIEPE